jgi:molybdopterin converting factor small subunit
MHVHIRFFGAVSKSAGFKESAVLDFQGETLGELLEAVMHEWPGTRDFIVGPQSATMVLALNDSALEPPDPSIKINDGDRLAIMPLVHGG